MDTREQLHTLIDELPNEVIDDVLHYILQKEPQAKVESRLQSNFQKILVEDRKLLERLAQ